MIRLAAGINILTNGIANLHVKDERPFQNGMRVITNMYSGVGSSQEIICKSNGMSMPNMYATLCCKQQHTT